MPDSLCDTALDPLVGKRVPKILKRVLARTTGLDRLERLYRRLAGDENISSRLLQALGVEYSMTDADRAHIPRTGPALVVANHPHGILDGAILLDLLLDIRGDVKIIANGMLAAIPEIRHRIIEVDVFSHEQAARPNARAVRAAVDHISSGGLLAVFPAGEVSQYQWRRRAIEDSTWQSNTSRLAELAARRTPTLSVVPVHIQGGNGPMFHALGMLHPRLRTIQLARELLNRRGRKVGVRAGAPLAWAKLSAMASHRERMEYLRWRTYLLANVKRTTRSISNSVQVARAVRPDLLRADVEALGTSALLASSGDLHAYLATAPRIPNVLAEIGRLREETFRASGEGTGQATDIDRFDAEYLHLFLWNERTHEVAGAYRLAGTDVCRSLYTATLFQYGPRFLAAIGPALELGRSFVRGEYQRTFAPLLLLWKGIGRYIAEHPRYTTLFGPVSISNDYSSLSRELMVGWLERNASLHALKHLVSSRNPFRWNRADDHRCAAQIEDLSAVIADIEPEKRGVPVLLRQYLKLGGKLLAFNVDPEFSNALDGLILVDLTRTDRKLLERYLGATEARRFLDYQKGSHAA